MDEYNTSITHDIRTPFHCVKGISYIIFHCTVIILGVNVKGVNGPHDLWRYSGGI